MLSKSQSYNFGKVLWAPAFAGVTVLRLTISRYGQLPIT